EQVIDLFLLPTQFGDPFLGFVDLATGGVVVGFDLLETLFEGFLLGIHGQQVFVRLVDMLQGILDRSLYLYVFGAVTRNAVFVGIAQALTIVEVLVNARDLVLLLMKTNVFLVVGR